MPYRDADTRREYARAYYQKNRGRIEAARRPAPLEYQRAYRARHITRLKAYRREYYASHRASAIAYARTWASKNPDRVRATQLRYRESLTTNAAKREAFRERTRLYASARVAAAADAYVRLLLAGRDHESGRWRKTKYSLAALIPVYAANLRLKRVIRQMEKSL